MGSSTYLLRFFVWRYCSPFVSMVALNYNIPFFFNCCFWREVQSTMTYLSRSDIKGYRIWFIAHGRAHLRGVMGRCGTLTGFRESMTWGISKLYRWGAMTPRSARGKDACLYRSEACRLCDFVLIM